MGNKTRQHHNIGMGPNKRPLAPLAKDNTVIGLNFPFIALADLESILGDIPNRLQVEKACPQAFQNRNNPWQQAASNIFYKGIDFRDLSFRTTDKPLIGAQMRYLRCWLQSFEPSHENKLAVCGWLLSLMLKEYPRS